MTQLLAPGLQSPDGRNYPDGLVISWRSQVPSGAAFPLAFKIRESFDTGWRVALVEAMAYAVPRLHIALIPNWSGGQPDWRWIRGTLTELLSLVTSDTVQVFVRLGNYRDGEGVTFEEHALNERTFGGMLAATRFRWSVGDDRGLVAAMDGWKVRKQVFAGGPVPVMIEAQPYGETSGMTESHPAMFRSAMEDLGFYGDLAFVEFHRWFKPQGQSWEDFKRLAEAATGEYLLTIHRACAAANIGLMIFTGDTAFQQLDPQRALNPAGLALFDKPRKKVAPWKPPTMRGWITSYRLGNP